MAWWHIVVGPELNSCTFNEVALASHLDHLGHHILIIGILYHPVSCGSKLFSFFSSDDVGRRLGAGQGALVGCANPTLKRLW